MASRSMYRLFVGNLPWTVSHSELRQYFSEFGHLVSARVVFNKDTGMSKGYGFVIFSTKGGYESVFNRTKHHLEGNNIVVEPSN